MNFDKCPACNSIISKPLITLPAGWLHDDVEFYSWPETFGSTSGPHGGCGGQMMTSFQVSAWHNMNTGEAVLECAGKQKLVKDFQHKYFLNWNGKN